MDIKPQPSRRQHTLFTSRSFDPQAPGRPTVVTGSFNGHPAAPSSPTLPSPTSPKALNTEPVSASSMRSAQSRKKKRLVILGVIAAVIGLGGGGGCFVLLQSYHPKVIPAVLPSHKYTPPQPTTVASALSGLPVDPNVNKRPVTAVMIENSLDARPQSGLDQANVVFEALAEGGVTRFMALFQDTQPDYIGPVRSARPYYIQWLLGFDAAYAHVGGSPDALSDINAWHVKDLNQFYNSSAYQRISSRYAPHNVYTSIAQLNQIETNKGFTSSSFTGFARKKEAPSKTPNATSIDLTFSGFYYNAHFDYNASTNSYDRSEAGAKHMELHKDGSRVQVSPKAVVAMVTPLSQGALDSSGAYYSNYNPIGSGPIIVFQDGVAQTGTWNKSSNNSQIVFMDASGQPLKLNPGQTWISAVSTASNVTYK